VHGIRFGLVVPGGKELVRRRPMGSAGDVSPGHGGDHRHLCRRGVTDGSQSPVQDRSNVVLMPMPLLERRQVHLLTVWRPTAGTPASACRAMSTARG
jgi:hypothetical protein